MPVVTLTALLPMQMFGLGRGKRVCGNTAAECRGRRAELNRFVLYIQKATETHGAQFYPDFPQMRCPDSVERKCFCPLRGKRIV